MNQKGIILSSLVYVLLVFFLLVLMSLLMVLWYRQNAINSLGKDANEIYDGTTFPFTTDYDYEEGVNVPRLVEGMTPIKWNGSAWVNTTENDKDWYSYKTDDKKWANAKTADGSMWVWIPRYAYQITTGYHTSTTGTINVKFLIDQTNKTSDSTTISTIPTYSGSSQTNYIAHPGFNFGNIQLTGMWVAKFEPSGSLSAIDIKPNVTPIASMSIGDEFTAARNMETNTRYGWGSSGTDFDTHMAKNVEWGAAAYLAYSPYGKNSEIWNNPTEVTITGCAGDTASAAASYCVYSYDNNSGMQASTTGTIYGIYDMAGGSEEHTAAYINNGSASLTTNGSSIVNAEDKYKDVYLTGTDQVSTYNNMVNVKGDAVWEISSSFSGASSWYGGYIYSPESGSPWFVRGGFWDEYSSDILFFNAATGAATYTVNFRPVLVVGSGF